MVEQGEKGGSLRKSKLEEIRKTGGEVGKLERQAGYMEDMVEEGEMDNEEPRTVEGEMDWEMGERGKLDKEGRVEQGEERVGELGRASWIRKTKVENRGKKWGWKQLAEGKEEVGSWEEGKLDKEDKVELGGRSGGSWDEGKLDRARKTGGAGGRRGRSGGSWQEGKLDKEDKVEREEEVGGSWEEGKLDKGDKVEREEEVGESLEEDRQ
ncbi:calcium-binding and coiled-coil domain-containing protein 2-like [Haliotis rubra]|uniref:calcium-binding and coiled-coil domain-containing protein 2-like n=1 Tax=Haliotis rubra TaxID=36100 RepID=UPI001EE55A08|nr:calcium-binding and coiled-coil domain-containing protein 2-like [Haliotis rubra]